MPLNQINFFAQNVTIPVRNKKLVRKWLLLLIQQEMGQKVYTEINFIFCEDDYLHQLNTKYLQHDVLTDIITFNYSEHNTVKGDIFISTDRIKENAKMYLQTYIGELSRVMAHGVLHLCGYKDKLPRQKKIMTAKENFYLKIQYEFAKNKR
ncbi:MAG: rRNA maturation RNase YbeY [Bacteroidota bacterium]